jgi:hypothetical protein
MKRRPRAAFTATSKKIGEPMGGFAAATLLLGVL